ncbi:MAG: outer membrane beta-barrel protein [Verrucomicrobiae bacterium]|nr:outer membrane beta-barrel protein [Verrucomicrobiae bacterium]
MNPNPRTSTPRLGRFLPAGLAAAILGWTGAAVAQESPDLPPPTTPAAPADAQPSSDPVPDLSQPDPGPTPILPAEPRPWYQPGTPTPPRLDGFGLPQDPATRRPSPTSASGYQDWTSPPPWIPEGTPIPPSWADPDASTGPFQQPGLGTSSFGTALLPAAPPPARSFGSTPPIAVGPFDLRPSLAYRVVYGSGILSGPGRESATWQHSITPGLTLYAGDHWTVRYAPSIRLYSADAYDTAVNHMVTLDGWAAWQNWRFRLNHASALTEDPLIETARQTDQNTHSTGLGATWDRGPRGVFDTSLNQNLRFTDAFTDSLTWTSHNWYDYPFWPKLRVGAGFSLGYDLLDPGSNMLNERLNLRVSGELGDKISFTVGGGVEFRQFLDTDAPTSVSPLANASLRYQILTRTALTASVAHDVSTSYFTDQFTQNTTLQGGVSQVLTDRWTLAANGGYRFTRYESTLFGSTTEREDDSVFAGATLGARLFPSVRASLFYTYRRNNSDRTEFSSDSHQVGLNMSWTL